MAKQVTIKAPSNNGLMEITGTVALLDVGGKKVKFLIHTKPEPTLTHYASGLRIATLNPVKVSAGVGTGFRYMMSDREAAVKVLERIIKNHGVEGTLLKFNGAEVINK